MKNNPPNNRRRIPAPPDISSSTPDPARPADPAPAPRSRTGQFLPGRSGNPKGRPPSPLSQANLEARALVQALLDQNAQAVTEAVIREAAAGNALAIKLCLERINPAPNGRTVPFSLKAPARLSPQDPQDILTQHNAVLHAVADGTLSPAEGQAVSEILEGRRRSWESFHIDERLTALEERAQEIQSNPPKPNVRWVDDEEDDRDDSASDHESNPHPNSD